MTKLTIDDVDFRVLAFRDFRVLAFDYDTESKNYKNLVAHIDAKLKEAYEQGKKDGMQLPSIEWESLSATKVPRAALTDFIKNWCQSDSEKIALASAAFYACANGIQCMPLPKEQA